MISEEIILQRDRVECFINELQQIIELSSVYEIKLRFTEAQIVIVPLHSPIVVKR